MAVFLAALGYGLALALLLSGAFWVYRRVRGRRQGFPWALLAALWLPASAGVFALIYATWES